MNKKIMRDMGFEKEIELISDGKCPMCKNRVDTNEFRDQLSFKEFKISGLCQACQDGIFE